MGHYVLARFPVPYKADTVYEVLNTDILCTQCNHILQTVRLNKHVPRVTVACYLAQTFHPYTPLCLRPKYWLVANLERLQIVPVLL